MTIIRLILTITKVKFLSCDDDQERVEISYKQGSSCMLGKNIPHIMPFEILSYEYLATIFTFLPSHRRVDRRCHNLTLVSMGKDTGWWSWGCWHHQQVVRIMIMIIIMNLMIVMIIISIMVITMITKTPRVGEMLEVNCSSPASSPPAKLRYFINNMMVITHYHYHDFHHDGQRDDDLDDQEDGSHTVDHRKVGQGGLISPSLTLSMRWGQWLPWKISEVFCNSNNKYDHSCTENDHQP